MKQFLKVQLLKEGKVLGVAKYLHLDTFAPNSGRKFIFSKLVPNKDFSIEYADILKVKIFGLCKHYYRKQCLFDFEINILDYGYPIDTTWWVYGLIKHNSLEEYKQGVIDIFHLWQNDSNINWNNIPFNSIQKKDYISACFFYSSLPTKVLEKSIYYIDLSFVNEEYDLLYLLSKVLLGDKGYIGHNIFTFDDCLLEIFNNYGYFIGKSVVFKNIQQIKEKQVFKDYTDFKKTLLKYKFLITEE